MRVRDEVSGRLLVPAQAVFVTSEVFTHRESANRTHVFAERAEAERHAAEYRGELVPSPFERWR